MADIPTIINALRQRIDRFTLGDDTSDPSYTPPIPQEPVRDQSIFSLVDRLAQSLLSEQWPLPVGIQNFFGNQIAYWTKKFAPTAPAALESTPLIELPPDVLEAQMFEYETRGDYVGAARMAMALLWANVTDEQNYRIEDAMYGEINPPTLVEDKAEWGQQTAEFMNRGSSPAMIAEIQQTHRVLASAILHFLEGDAFAAKERLDSVIKTGRLFDPKSFPLAKKLTLILRIKDFYTPSTSDAENPFQSRLQILLAFELQNFLNLCNRKKDVLRDMLFMPEINLSVTGDEYLTLVTQIVDDISRWRDYPAQLDWHNFFKTHIQILSTLFPIATPSEHAAIAEWLFLRFGHIYYQFDPRASKPINWKLYVTSLKEKIGEPNLNNIPYRKDLNALYLQGKISEEMMTDANDFYSRVEAHVEGGTPLTLFPLFNIVGVDEPQAVEEPLFDIVGAVASTPVEDDCVIHEPKEQGPLSTTPLPAGVLTHTPVGKTPLAVMARTHL